MLSQTREMVSIDIRPWTQDDLPLLVTANMVEMTQHLAGPESDDQVRVRHQNYLDYWRDGTARMFAVTADGESVGGIGWWTTLWRGEKVHETGWFTVPGAQGRGIARAALALIIDDARAHRRHDLLTAFPSVDNGPSNALCEKCGFRVNGVESFPFRGQELTVNAWTLDLRVPGSD